MDNNSTISELASAIAHEVKNPISLVSANIDLIESKDKSRIYEDNYNIMRKELSKINDIMIDFINLTEIPENSHKPLLIYNILYSTMEPYINTLKDKIKINIFCGDKMLQTAGREKSLTMLFSNIIKNSVEAICSIGFIDINLYGEHENVIIEFKDSGTGLSYKTGLLKENKFFTTKESGSGLGILICKKIATEHSGTFDLYNWERGCTAKVTLPKY